MESPPSCSTWSEVFIASDDSGLLLTSGSISSGSMSGDSRSGQFHFALEYQNSDFEDKSLSQADSLDDMSDIICGENFNTLKKGPNWSDISSPKHILTIEPPPEFQDKPTVQFPEKKLCVTSENLIPVWLSKFSNQIMLVVIKDALELCCSVTVNRSNSYYKCLPHQKQVLVTPRTFWTSDWLPFSPCHNTAARPSSRNSLGSSRLSCSHNSLSVPSTCKVDDSNFITQAVSHDTLTSNQISDLYNVPFDSDIYAVPVDVVKPPLKPKRNHQQKSRRRNTCFLNESIVCDHLTVKNRISINAQKISVLDSVSKKRHSVAGTSVKHMEEPIHMTLQEVRQYLQTLYSSSSDSSDSKVKQEREKIRNESRNSERIISNNKNRDSLNPMNNKINSINDTSVKSKNKRNNFVLTMKNRKIRESIEVEKRNISNNNNEQDRSKRCPVKTFSSSLKQTICNLFRFRWVVSPRRSPKYTSKNMDDDFSYNNSMLTTEENRKGPLASRALPPLPSEYRSTRYAIPGASIDFATSLDKVKDYGWYWGPISSEAAERILLNEPDGSFIVRDSSDDHYIFSLTFKLNSGVRHVRIEHDQGNFSFGSCTKFKSHTIIEFIENAVEHSRSGRYLFFLHRRPILGPMRVQLLHPVSRFKQIQSLQHMCRFVILKVVRKDRIPSLPLPRRIIDYLSSPHYYSEQLLELEESANSQENNPSTQVIEDTRQS